MSYSGKIEMGPPSPTSPAELYDQHLIEIQYEREDVQKKTFGKWINSQLIKINFSLVTDLFYDLRDGTRLLALLSVLTGRTHKPEKGHMRVHHLNNVSTAFRLLDKHNVKLVNISSNDIVDGNPKLTLGLVWSIILHWQVQDVLRGSSMAELQQSSLDKTLLSWCQEATKDYSEVAVTNFTTSWSDGLAFNALIHRFRPDLFDYEIVSRKQPNARLEYAFRTANKHLGIARLLDPEDVNTSTPDKKSIMMYVMCLYQALPHAKIPLVPANGNTSSVETTAVSTGASAVSRSTSNNEPVDFTAYQTLMEEVLVWLLAAEDHLDSASTNLTDLQSVKEQFHKHEEFLLELTSQQGSVGAVLHEGARLVKEGQLSNEEADEIHIQMRLLNSRWDQLRTKSMDRQACIHETLTKLQQEQLERLRQWLTATEDRISQLAAVSQPETFMAASQMLEDHQSLQRDLEAQQEHVNGLSNMVVIVDESASDNCAQMEDQLSALGERWSHVCRWADQRASSLQQLSHHWQQLDTDLNRLKSWLAAHEHSLRLIETNPSADRSQMIDVARQLQLLERDMEPNIQRLNQLQENIQRLPALIQAITVKENSKKIQPIRNFKCVDRLSSDVEHLEDRIEALNEIMEAQRQRVAKSGVDLTMVVLPPDITASLSAFGSTDAINSQSRFEEEATSIKKRKLESDRRFLFEEAIRMAKQHLDEIESLLDCDSRTEDLEKSHTEKKNLLDQVLKSGHVLVDELENDADEVFDVEDIMSSITERWLLIEEVLEQRTNNQQENDRVLQAKICENEVDGILNTATKLCSLEDQNEETLSKIQAILRMAKDQMATLSPAVEENCEKLNEALNSLKSKINQLELKISEFEKDVVLYKQLKDESQSLDKWMAEVQKFLTAEEVGWGDVEVLEAQLEQSNALQDDVKTLEPSVSNVKHVISLLAPKVDENLLNEMNRISQRLATTWITVIADALQKNGVLNTALSLTRQTVEGIESTELWLNELEVEVPPPAIINSTSELSQTLRKLNALKNRVDLKTNEYKIFMDAGNAVIANPIVGEEMRNSLSQLTQRWNNVAGGVLERQRALKAASHHYGEFKVLTAQECDWQDKLDKKLMRSTTLAADAEEISEELDDLENYMKNRPIARILRIESMGNELVSLNIMTESVGSEVRSLVERWATLNEKAKAKAEWLEKRVRGAQQCEQRLVQLHSAISSIDAELCSSLEQDLYGDELPELSQRLSQDIAQQEALLSEIRHEEEDYQAEGRKEAANRLHEQLSFIEATLQDVRNKFRKFQNPSELEPRLERMLRILRDLEQSMCYIELASDDCEAIEGQLNNCIRFYASLSDIKTEVEAVLREGRQQVEEGLVEDHITVSAELDAMKALYNRLGEQVAVARETLERALQLSYQLNLELNSVTDWLNHLVSEIHKTEGTFVDNPNTLEEIRFYEKCLSDMVDNQTKMENMRDNYEAFCGLCDPNLLDTLRERVEDLTQEWQRIEERLKNKIANLKEESGDIEENQDTSSTRSPHQHRNGDVPVRMYRSVVLTSVRQFTDPGSPTSQKTCLELPASPTLTEDMDPRELSIDGEPDGRDSAFDEETDVPVRSPSADTLGYFNAAFEDFDEQEKEAYQPERISPSRSGLEVIRGNIVDFDEEDEEMIESSSSSPSSSSTDSSSEPSESGSVKHMSLEMMDENPPGVKELTTLHIEENNSFVVEIQSGQLPSPEVPSMEILSSRPITPEDFLTPEEEQQPEFQEALNLVQQSDSVVVQQSANPTTLHDQLPEESQLTFERAVMERFSFQQLPSASQDRSGSPVGTDTPPPTPAHSDLNVFSQAFTSIQTEIIEQVLDDPAATKVQTILVEDDVEEIPSDTENAVVMSNDPVEGVKESQVDIENPDVDRFIEVELKDPYVSDDFEEESLVMQENPLEGVGFEDVALIVEDCVAMDEVENDQSISEDSLESVDGQVESVVDDGAGGVESQVVELDSDQSMSGSTDDQMEKETFVHKCPLDQDPSPPEADSICDQTGSILLVSNEAREEDAHDPAQRLVSVNIVRQTRKVSRDEGTQTDFCGHTGRLHVTPLVPPAQLTSIIDPQTIPLQVDDVEMETSNSTTDQMVEQIHQSSSLQEIDPVELNLVAESAQNTDEIPSPLSDDQVFATQVDQLKSEPKTSEDVDSFYGSDKEVDGEVVFSHTDSSASSSASSDSDVEPDKDQQNKKEKKESSLDQEVMEFNREVALMLKRIADVTVKFSPSSSIDLESAEMELSLLEPDVATLISRGDSLVLQVQKVDLERALGINTTTGELRGARTALKASSEVRRQRQVEQELTLKDCQRKTEQLQLWLANIAQTLDHVTRINDQSQLESLEEELNRRQSDIRQLTEAAGKLKEQQVLEYQALISSLTIRWQDLQRQFVDFQTRETSRTLLCADPSDDSTSMGGPDFVTRVNKLREAIASVSRQMHSPPLNLRHYEQLSGQEDSVKAVKSALYTLKSDVDTYNREKNDAVEATDDVQHKEQIQRILDKLREEWTLLNRTFAERQARVHQSLTTWRSLHADMKDFDDWLTGAEASLVHLQSEGHNRAERKEKLKELESQVTARHKVMSNITSTCREVAVECSTADAVLLREKQDMLGKRWRSLLSGLAAVRQRLTSLDGSPLPVSKLTPLVMSTPRKDETNGSETDLTLASTPKETPPSTPSTIVASLDKSILQIRDWLTVLETMLKQQVAIVGDSDDVIQLLEKQKNVLRELEQKKPQLDELVQTAESIKDGGPLIGGKQLPAQVSKLREHWEETANAVTARRNQLEELLADSHQFERRKQDVDQWLGRMENRLSKLAPVAGTADLIDSQHREQKVLHNEIQQYKGQVDQLGQLSDRLVSSYPHDDTSRAIRTNDNLNQRYSALHTGVNTRGRALNAAMSSLHSFDRSLDKFMAWLSDAESSLESLELELDSYGPGVKTSRERVLMQLKELSVELDGRRDEQAGLAGAGQRLINTLSDGGSGQNHSTSSQQTSNHDDALMLRRRLDDMNRRWHGLRAKTVAIRNRLENNTEHWNALLLSLRELIEWVIRKDTELTGLGPVRGDLSTLVKQQDDFRAFRRQLDDKRPLIEQSILTGRQLVANEAPLSDASDSEAANRDLLPGDSRGYRSAEEAARELTQGIRREGTKLAERWAALRDRTERWNVDLDTTTNRVQQLQGSMDDASNRLVPAEAARSKWINPTELSPQQVQQQMDQLKELSDKIAPVQLTIEEVNDQAARLADSGVPLSHANLSRLDDLNSRWKVLQSSMDDRYQQLCGVTRDGALSGPLLHSFLAASVDRPWERSVTEADVPYYVNHQTETTQWDHPQLEELMNSLSEFNDVRFSAYRMALKLRRVQKFLCLDKLELSTAIDTFDAHGLRAQNDKVIDIPDMVTVLRSLYDVVVAAYPGEIRLPLMIDLCLNWILNVYDSQRSGEVRVLSFKVIITLMCRGHLEEKYRYLFRLIADPNRLVDAPKLGVLLHDCVQMPRELGEVAAFGGSNIEPSVKSCFDKAGKQRQSIEAVHFLAWMKREPQSVVWLPVLHRLAASESARHQSKCNVCKTTPIIGLRYRCLKCLSFDMCQTCFFTGRVSKHHKLTHPMQEYCTTTTSGEDLKDFTRTLRNKFKSKRYFKKHPRLGYLPVQTALEGTATPSDVQSEISSQMPSSVAQDVLVHSAATSVMDGIHKDYTPESEDEHQLIAQYCRSLNGDSSMSMGAAPRSPVQLLAALDSNHKEEIETMIRELEEENATLQAEYERLRSQQSPSMSFSFSSSPDDTTPIPHQGGASASGNPTSDVERDMLAEARLLRQHKTRLEARMKILEEHNRQLETQLSRLRQLLDEPAGNASSPAKTGTLQTRSVTAAHLATDTPVRTNGIGNDSNHSWAEHGVMDRLETRPPPPPHGTSANSNTYNAQNVGNLLFMAGDLGKAVGSLVNVMTDANDHSPGLTDEEN